MRFSFFTMLLSLFFFCFTYSAISQKLPKSNIYMFEIKEESDSTYLFSKPAYLTSFNAEGYNNQPYFVSDHELYFTVQLSDDTTQTDIYGVDLKANTLTQITATPESEYSAQLIPRTAMGELGEKDFPPMFSCIRVESDGVTQRIWEFPLNRSNNGRPAVYTISNVGYYCWVAQNGLATFLVGDPHQLAMVNKVSGDFKNITSNIGRCLQRLPKGKMAFVHKLGRTWIIKEYDPITSRTSLLTGALPGSEDFAVLPDGTLLMGNGSKLYKFHKGLDSGWREVADFSYHGINNITRLAVWGNRIAIVNQ